MPSSGLEYHPLQGTAVCPSRPNGGEKANIFKQKTPNFLDALLCPQADSNTIPFRGPLFEPRVPVGGERAHIFKQKRPRNWALFCAPKGPPYISVLRLERVFSSTVTTAPRGGSAALGPRFSHTSHRWPGSAPEIWAPTF